MEFPKFQQSDVLRWILKCERYFKLDETLEELKVTMASLHLDEKAFQWHQAYEKTWEDEILDWEEYEDTLKNRFGPSSEAPMEDLMILRQQGSLVACNDSFDSISCKLKLTEEYLVHAYIASLEEEYAGPVHLFKLVAIKEARSLARVQEINMQKKNGEKVSNKQVVTFGKNGDMGILLLEMQFLEVKMGGRGSRTIQQQVGTIQEIIYSSWSLFPTSQLQESRKSWHQEVEKYHAQNLCFYCHGKFSNDHRCSQRRKLQLYMIDCESEEEEPELGFCEEVRQDDQELPPQISLHATEGIDGTSSMRVHEQVGRRLVQILIDNGSTHDLLDLSLAKKLGWCGNNNEGSEVGIAGGGKLGV